MIEYKAQIIGPGGHRDPLAQDAGIVIARRTSAGTETLRMTDKGWYWGVVNEGEVAHLTVEFPAEALDALVEAVDRYEGAPSHAKTEAAVLREWLRFEQRRVDDLIALATQAPRIIDHSLPGPMIVDKMKPSFGGTRG